MKNLCIGLIALFVCLLFVVLQGCNPNINYFTVEMDAATNDGKFDTDRGNATNIFVIEANGSAITTSKKSDAKGDFDIPVTDIIKEVLPTTVIPDKDDGVAIDPPEVIEPLPIGNNTESGKLHGVRDDNRDMWHFAKDMKEYPSVFQMASCTTFDVQNNGVRFEGNGYIVKQSDVPAYKMVLVTPKSCKGKIPVIRY